MDTAPIWRRPVFILISCIVMVMIAYGTRQSFGLYMQPMSVDMGWGREVLSVALATQNLLMGAGAAFAGALATRWGAAKTIAIGGGLYASGLFSCRNRQRQKRSSSAAEYSPASGLVPAACP